MQVNETVKRCIIIFRKRKRSRRVCRIHSEKEGANIMSMTTLTFPEWIDSFLCYLVLLMSSGRSLLVLPASFPICKVRLVILTFVKTV